MASNISMYTSIIIISGILITITGINKVIGQEDSTGHILATASLNIDQLEMHLSNCEKFNESGFENVELAELCLEYVKDFNSKFSELRTQNPKYFEAIENLLQK
jgi:hypothetical protein